MNAAIEKIKYLQSLQTTVNKTSDEEFYVIDGVRSGRVTRSYEGLKTSHFSVLGKDDILHDWANTTK